MQLNTHPAKIIIGKLCLVVSLLCGFYNNASAQPLPQLQTLLNTLLQAKVQSQYTQPMPDGEDTLTIVEPFAIQQDSLSLTTRFTRMDENNTPAYFTEKQVVALKDLQMLESDIVLCFKAGKNKVKHYYTTRQHGQTSYQQSESGIFVLFIPFEKNGKKVCESIANLLAQAHYDVDIADWIYTQ